MLFYNIKSNSRSLAGEHIACPIITVKNKGLVFLWDAKPLIYNVYVEAIIVLRDPKLYVGILVGIFYGVVQQIGQGQFHDLFLKGHGYAVNILRILDSLALL